MIEVSAKKVVVEGEEARSATVMVDLGENLQDAIAKFGEEVVFSNFQANAKITCQAAIRRMLESNMDQGAIAARMAGWKPGQVLERVAIDPVVALKAKFQTMDADAKKALLAELKAAAQG